LAGVVAKQVYGVPGQAGGAAAAAAAATKARACAAATECAARMLPAVDTAVHVAAP